MSESLKRAHHLRNSTIPKPPKRERGTASRASLPILHDNLRLFRMKHVDKTERRFGGNTQSDSERCSRLQWVVLPYEDREQQLDDLQASSRHLQTGFVVIKALAVGRAKALAHAKPTNVSGQGRTRSTFICVWSMRQQRNAEFHSYPSLNANHDLLPRVRKAKARGAELNSASQGSRAGFDIQDLLRIHVGQSLKRHHAKQWSLEC